MVYDIFLLFFMFSFVAKWLSNSKKYFEIFYTLIRFVKTNLLSISAIIFSIYLKTKRSSQVTL